MTNYSGSLFTPILNNQQFPRFGFATNVGKVAATTTTIINFISETLLYRGFLNGSYIYSTSLSSLSGAGAADIVIVGSI